MNRFMTTALTLTLLATSAAASAQEGRWSNGDPRNGGGHARAGAMINQRPEPQPQAVPEQQQQGQWSGERRSRGGDGGGWSGQRRGGGDPNAGAAPAGQPATNDAARNWQGRRDGDGSRNWQGRQDGQRNAGDRNWQGRRDGGERRDWSNRNSGWNDRGWNPGRDWRQDRPRYDRRAYPPVYRNHERFRVPAYRAPRGFYVRSWAFGDVLPRGWYGEDYRLYDWFDYGLPIPPVGYDWVRIGDDAVLIDTFTGRVVQVVYDLFW